MINTILLFPPSPSLEIGVVPSVEVGTNITYVCPDGEVFNESWYNEVDPVALSRTIIAPPPWVLMPPPPPF